MVGGFFPTPYPDECYYSILCRYFTRSGSTSSKRTIKELFGSMQCLSTSVFFPIRLGRLDSWVPSSSGITRQMIVQDHTMYPYMVISCPPDFRDEMNSAISEGSPDRRFDLMGTHRSLDLWPRYLRFCPECVRDDTALYGEPYWHRVHQLPGMAYCPKHAARIVDSHVSMHSTTTIFHAASSTDLSRRIPDDLICHKEKFLKIAKESEWLLNNGMSLDWDFDYHKKYKWALRERDIATIQGVSDHRLIISHFNEHWGSDFLESLYSVVGNAIDWIRQIYSARIMMFKPIYHILLMCFLEDSIKSFMESEPSENPFGKAPWPCMNPLCPHYLIDGCSNTGIRYLNGVATGFFRCDFCGMVYRQLKRKGKTGNCVIVDYGPVWKSELVRCLGTEKMTAPQAAEVLKCKEHVVSWQKKKMGLCKKHECSRAQRRYDPEIGSDNYYKAQVLKLCEEYEEVTIALLNERAPGAYSYFSKHDFSWLRERIVYERDSARQKEYEQDLLKRVKEAVAQIKESGNNNKQLTRGYLASVAGIRESQLACTEWTRPLLKAYLDTVIESREEWLRRRIVMIWEKQKLRGKPIALADIKREMSLKPNTYIKYKELIEELIDELNTRN